MKKGTLITSVLILLLTFGCKENGIKEHTSTPPFIIDSHTHYGATMRPGYLADIASEHPGLFIHAPHFGNPWYNEAGEATRRNVNLYFDLTGSSLIKKDKDPGFWKQFLWWTPYLGKAHMPKDAVPAFEKILFATDEGPEAFEENIQRFNKMPDACGVSEETRAKSYGLTMAGVHGINVHNI